MNLYQYIAEANPNAANDICKRYGYYQINSYEELTYCLESIVAQHGEHAFKDIMKLHPDMEVIMELNVKPAETIQTVDMGKCPCESSYKNMSGDNNANSGLTNQTNVMILVAAMIVSIAIISMKK